VDKEFCHYRHLQMIVAKEVLECLGWKAFQDLCVAIVEERLHRAVQTFLPSNDAGRDGAFIGLWDSEEAGESTIQCKFTSDSDRNLVLSMLTDELPKAKRLAEKGLADDYIILTNHPITGESELRIREAFQSNGVGRCRVFHRDWILARIRESPKLRMMVPRLYGLIDLTSLLDDRAYRQSQLILSEMGDNLQKFVVTEAHRRSVRAIGSYNLVLLLGSPAAGKSTIGASLALGASDTWNCSTIKSTSPEHLEKYLDTDGGQFVWIDDAWGTTQYQGERTEGWNQVFPLMQGAMKRGTRFLITSRDYIWRTAKKELKLQALPVLMKSQVIIDVHGLTLEERARILYNHVKLGDQGEPFRKSIKPLLPGIARSSAFLPESARRLGTKLLTERLVVSESGLADFFERPKEFLEETLESLAPQSLAAIALIFLNGGKIRSPVPMGGLAEPSTAFGVSPASIKAQLEALRGSLLNFAEDDEGPYWTYRHPTISDAFASYIAKSPEMIEIYLCGAKPESIVQEVICAGEEIAGASVVIPNSMHDLLLDRIGNLPSGSLTIFICYRSNPTFTARLLEIRPDLLKRMESYFRPLKDDLDADLLCRLHEQKLLPPGLREKFVEEVHSAAVDEADASFLEVEKIGGILTNSERSNILSAVKVQVLDQPDHHVQRLRSDWDADYDPYDFFDEFRSSVNLFATALSTEFDPKIANALAETHIQVAIDDLQTEYEPPQTADLSTPQTAAQTDSLEDVFRDVDAPSNAPVGDSFDASEQAAFGDLSDLPWKF